MHKLVATLKSEDDNSFNLLQLLKKTYNHFEMGIYLTALDDGEINIENTVDL